MDSPVSTHPGARIAAALQLWFVNLGIAGIVALGYLQRAPDDLSLRGITFLIFGFLSSLGMLSIVPGAISLFWASLNARPVALSRRLGVLWTLALALLYADTRVFGVFQFHLNAVIWNSLTTPGSGDAIHPGVSDVVLPALAIVGVITCQAHLFRWLLAGCERRAAARRARGALGPGALAAGVLLLAFTAERNLYAHDVEEGRHELATLSELLPYYQLPQDVMRSLRGAPPTAAELVFDLRERELEWPSETVQWDRTESRPNVLVLVLDSLRGDMLNQETMPRTWAFSQNARVYEDHWSGGNCTRHGIFTLLYGLPGNYWEPVLRVQHSPLLLDVMLEQGYEPRVLCSASQSFPEFRSTAWATIPHAVEDEFEGEVWEKDLQVAARFGDWLDQRDDPSRPFFVFSLLDGAHANYSFPEDATHFEPCADSIEYIRMSYGLDEAHDRAAVFNRYRNAVRQTDLAVGQMLHHLGQRGLLEDTIVVLTGDHGEEFFDNGFWGHHSNFTPAQVHVPFVLHGPGISAGVETRPSSHLDLARTLLERLGVSPEQAPAYSIGENLLDLPEQRTVLSASWSSMAVRLENRAALVISDYADDLPLRAYGPDGKPLRHEIEALRESAPKLEEVLALCQRFLRVD